MTVHHSDDCNEHELFKDQQDKYHGYSMILSGREHTFTAEVNEDQREKWGSMPIAWEVVEKGPENPDGIIISDENYVGDSYTLPPTPG